VVRRRLLFVFATVVAAGLVLFACSDDEPASSPVATEAGADSTQRDPPVDDGIVDAGVDQDAKPPPILPGCVGTSIPLTVDGLRTFVGVKLSASPPDAGHPPAQGDFLVDFGTTGSTIDFHAFDASAPPMPAQCFGDASIPGASCNFAGFDFFGDWGQVTLRTGDYGIFFGAIRQAGIIGTDFLSIYPFALEFTNRKMWKSAVATFCTDTQLLAAGFLPLPSKGFFVNDLSKLRPLADVITEPDAGVQNFTVPNVPTVPISIAGINALAQLDTGYDDSLRRHSININEALFKLIEAQSGPTKLLTRAPLKDLFATTCVPGYSERLQAYNLAEGKTIDFIAEGGSVARAEQSAVIYVKPRSAETYRCGGVSTWSVPGAQVGASFYIDAQAIIFDPITSRVWVPKN